MIMNSVCRIMSISFFSVDQLEYFSATKSNSYLVSYIISNDLSRQPSLIDVESDVVMLPVHTLLLQLAGKQDKNGHF